MSSELTLYFPHAGKGQSILVQMPPNDWIVIDANKPPNDQENVSCKILEPFVKERNFRLVALVLTHSHHDHYSGLPDILQLCERAARAQRRPLKQLLPAFILPCTYDLFDGFLERKGKPKPGNGHLRRLRKWLPKLKRSGVAVRPLAPLQFAWRGSGAEVLQEDEPWLFTFYPSTQDILKEIFSRFDLDDPLGEVLKPHPEWENRYTYVLGVGYGPDPGNLHFLLMSDVPGSVFSKLTHSLREEILPDVRNQVAGCARGIQPLIHRLKRQGKAEDRLHPVRGMTVPHHGSTVDPARHEDLGWWLADDREQPALAIVQGGPHALGEDTVRELSMADLSLFATALPERLLYGNGVCRELSGSRLQSPLRPAVPSFELHGEVVAVPSHVVPHLLVQGGGRGIHAVIAKEIYEIRFGPPSVWYHSRAEIFFGQRPGTHGSGGKLRWP